MRNEIEAEKEEKKGGGRDVPGGVSRGGGCHQGCLYKKEGEGEGKGIKGVCGVGKGNIRENREGEGERGGEGNGRERGKGMSIEEGAG